MFKISLPINKSFQVKNGKIIVEGIASDPTIDRDEERFDASALIKMASSIAERQIPIRMEHENKVYTDIGIWKEAKINEDGKLYVKGEIDTEMSLGKDIGVLLNRGTSLALSVGGQVLDAGYEYNNELKKNIKVYKDVILNEISVIKNPSNYNVSLSLAKSVDWQKLNSVEKTEGNKIEYTTEAKKIMEVYKTIEKVSNSNEDAVKGLENLNEKRKKFLDSAKKFLKNKNVQFVVGMTLAGVAIAAPPTGFAALVTMGAFSGFVPAALGSQAAVLTGIAGGWIGSGAVKDIFNKARNKEVVEIEKNKK